MVNSFLFITTNINILVHIFSLYEHVFTNYKIRINYYKFVKTYTDE